MTVLGEEEWEDLFGNSMEMTSFDGFSFKSSSEEDININRQECIVSGRNNMAQK